MTARLVSAACSLVLLVGFVACGDDDPTTPTSQVATLYWFESPSSCDQGSIRRMDTNETTPTDVILLSGPDSIADLVVDQTGGKIYYTFGQSSMDNTETIERVDLDDAIDQPAQRSGERRRADALPGRRSDHRARVDRWTLLRQTEEALEHFTRSPSSRHLEVHRAGDRACNACWF